MDSFFNEIKGNLIVSCQHEDGSPFNNPESMANFAYCAWKGGAAAIRTEGIDNVLAISKATPLPIIGLVKSAFSDGSVLITGTMQNVEELVKAGCKVVAIDGTFRLRQGLSGPDFIKKVKREFGVLVMADIDGVDEADACIEAGADCISTTLAGYTPNTQGFNHHVPDLELLKVLCQKYPQRIPIIAEGRFNTPQLAKIAIEIGAWSVVAGTAITRPLTITKWFSNAIK
jgi:N-acylglucosamine-6-phosphate 2-epimerase